MPIEDAEEVEALLPGEVWYEKMRVFHGWAPALSNKKTVSQSQGTRVGSLYGKGGRAPA